MGKQGVGGRGGGQAKKGRMSEMAGSKVCEEERSMRFLTPDVSSQIQFHNTQILTAKRLTDIKLA